MEEKVEDLRALEEDMRLAAAKAADEFAAWKVPSAPSEAGHWNQRERSF